MKTKRKIISAISITLAALMIISFAVFTSTAIVEVKDGDFSYVSNTGGTFALYRYYGSETSIELPDEVFDTKVTAVYNGAFENSNLISVTIPEDYTSIGENAFFGCKSLTAVSLPSSLTKIGNSAFSGCSALTAADIPNNSALTEIGYAAFSGDENLSAFSLQAGLKTINSNAFANTGITEANVPDSVTSFGEGVFIGCSSLESAALPKDITEIPQKTFMDCTSLSSIDIPKKVVAIGDSAFYNCSSLSNVEFSMALETIGNSAFENAYSLTELFISDSVTSIGAYAFYPMSIEKTLTVTCFKHSYAAEYCYENLVKYEGVELGDVNLDGSVDILDVALIQQYKIGGYDISSEIEKQVSDVNRNGSITIRDATLIQMKLARIIDF